jgi:hypothetical protein
MKNIHVLSTEKPSELYINMQGTLSKDGLKMRLKNQNIYITSDEEIKEGDWVTNSLTIMRANLDGQPTMDDYHPWKKIIITTDQALIKDGVQAIDDEFLEWFVKNPSCEKVEIQDFPMTEKYNSKGEYIHRSYWIYKIIIPKEEICSFCDGTGQVVSSTTISRFKTCDCKIIPKDEIKKETLEEYFLDKMKEVLLFGNDAQAIRFMEKYFEAKQERSYSEEDMRDMYDYGYNNYLPIDKAFEQFKKK